MTDGRRRLDTTVKPGSRKWFLVIAALPLIVGCADITSSTKPEQYYSRGVHLGTQGRHAAALGAFREAVRLEPRVAQYHRNMGVALANLGRYDAALRAYQEAVRLEPDLAEAYINIAATLGHLGRNDEGLRAYQEGVRLKPDLAKSFPYLESTLKATKLPPVTDPTQRIEFQGFSVMPPRGENWSIQNPSAGHVIFTKDTAKGGYHTIIAFVRADHSDLTFKSSTEFLQHVERATERESQNPRFKRLDDKVSLESCQGMDCVRYNFALEDRGVPYAPGSVFILTGEEFYFLHPHSPKTFIIRIGYSQRFLRGENALPIQAEIEPFLRSLVFRGNILPDTEKEAAAKEYVMRSFRRVAQGDFHGAITDATRALQLDPRNDEAYFARGMGYEFLGQYDQAISDYDTVLEINPNHGYALWHKVKSHEKTGRVMEAEEALKAWCSRSPTARQHPFCR